MEEKLGGNLGYTRLTLIPGKHRGSELCCHGGDGGWRGDTLVRVRGQNWEAQQEKLGWGGCGLRKNFSTGWNRDFWGVQIVSLCWSFNGSEGPLSTNHSSGHYSWIKTFAICSSLKCGWRENLFPDETRNAHAVSAGHMFFPPRCTCLESSAQSWRMQGKRKRRENYRDRLITKNFLRLWGPGKVLMIDLPP